MPPPADISGYRRARRRAAAALALAAGLDLVSAITPPLRDRLHALLEVVPLAVPQVATALVVLAGLALLLLSRGVRAGQRRAWWLAVGVLASSSALHLMKGGDLEEAAVAAAVALYFVRHRDAFRAASDPVSGWRGLAWLVTGGATGALTGIVAVELRRPRLPLATAAAASLERLVGVRDVALPSHLDHFLAPALAALGFGLLVAVGWLWFRPVVFRRFDAPHDDPARARGIVARHGADTLSYFALRDDKRLFFHGDGLVAYTVLGGVCLVSPDPVAPVAERAALWASFRQFVDDHGWKAAVLGAGPEWVPLYEASGMRAMYIGDEGVIDVSGFSLEGHGMKGLRQATNRVARGGYSVTFFDPTRIEPALAAELRAVMTRSRRGGVERGFSMTLGRVFDPDDGGLLLAVAGDAEGRPAAFCQFVPAGPGRYSLDLMRRDDGDHPNGLIDFLLVRTLEHLRDEGVERLSLNFATMRAVLAGEMGEGLGRRAQRRLVRWLSGSMQIESLWYFNAKYQPEWHPRYAVYESPEDMVPAALAVARAESWWELPVIGRFLVPTPTRRPGPQLEPVPARRP